mmetsp:Transcript_12560/g.26431  ORF Transcript_12560/g.26431 Transcript_12560/m.26431 type:complete len:181 (+) Transcript_12560:419-961(+)
MVAIATDVLEKNPLRSMWMEGTGMIPVKAKRSCGWSLLVVCPVPSCRVVSHCIVRCVVLRSFAVPACPRALGENQWCKTNKPTNKPTRSGETTNMAFVSLHQDDVDIDTDIDVSLEWEERKWNQSTIRVSSLLYIVRASTVRHGAHHSAWCSYYAVQVPCRVPSKSRVGGIDTISDSRMP